MKEQLREEIERLWTLIHKGNDTEHVREKLALYVGMLRDLEVADAALETRTLVGTFNKRGITVTVHRG